MILMLVLVGNVFSQSGAEIVANDPSISKLDEKNGFRDAKFGSDISSFKNLKLIYIHHKVNPEPPHYRYYFRLNGTQDFKEAASYSPTDRKRIDESSIKFYVKA
ncbi:hypothetical protein OB13_05760, partial [Pontibacter sp. HJ8]